MSSSHRKVQVVVIAREGGQRFVLLLKTNEARGHFWQNITGSVENDETNNEAAWRELAEETGISTAALFPLPMYFDFTDSQGRSVREFCFLARLDKRPAIHLDPNEHESYFWKPIDAVTKSDYNFPSNHEAFEVAVAHA